MEKKIKRMVAIALTYQERIDLNAEIAEFDGKMMGVEKRRKAMMINSLRHIKALKEEQSKLLEISITGCKQEERTCPMQYDFNAKVKNILHPVTMHVLETLPLSDDELQVDIEDVITE